MAQLKYLLLSMKLIYLNGKYKQNFIFNYKHSLNFDCENLCPKTY